MFTIFEKLYYENFIITLNYNLGLINDKANSLLFNTISHLQSLGRNQSRENIFVFEDRGGNALLIARVPEVSTLFSEFQCN